MKTKGARKVLDRLYGLLSYEQELSDRARKIATEGYKLAIYNPKFAKELWEQIGQLEAERAATLADIRACITSQVEPYMERAAPKVEQRLADLERRLDELEARSKDTSEPQLRLMQSKRGTGG